MILLSFCFYLIASPFLSKIKAHTTFGDGSGIYFTMINELKKSMHLHTRVMKVISIISDRLMFVTWIQKYLYCMKAYKYNLNLLK